MYIEGAALIRTFPSCAFKMSQIRNRQQVSKKQQKHVQEGKRGKACGENGEEITSGREQQGRIGQRFQEGSPRQKLSVHLWAPFLAAPRGRWLWRIQTCWARACSAQPRISLDFGRGNWPRAPWRTPQWIWGGTMHVLAPAIDGGNQLPASFLFGAQLCALGRWPSVGRGRAPEHAPGTFCIVSPPGQDTIFSNCSKACSKDSFSISAGILFFFH